jgi:hypothetical protein
MKNIPTKNIKIQNLPKNNLMILCKGQSIIIIKIETKIVIKKTNTIKNNNKLIKAYTTKEIKIRN